MLGLQARPAQHVSVSDLVHDAKTGAKGGGVVNDGLPCERLLARDKRVLVVAQHTAMNVIVAAHTDMVAIPIGGSLFNEHTWLKLLEGKATTSKPLSWSLSWRAVSSEKLSLVNPHPEAVLTTRTTCRQPGQARQACHNSRVWQPTHLALELGEMKRLLLDIKCRCKQPSDLVGPCWLCNARQVLTHFKQRLDLLHRGILDLNNG